MSKSKRKSTRMTSYSDEVIMMRRQREKSQREQRLYQQAKEIRRSVKNLSEKAQNIVEEPNEEIEQSKPVFSSKVDLYRSMFAGKIVGETQDELKEKE